MLEQARRSAHVRRDECPDRRRGPGTLREISRRWNREDVLRADHLPEESQNFNLQETRQVNISFNDYGCDTPASLIDEHGLEAGDISVKGDS